MKTNKQKNRLPDKTAKKVISEYMRHRYVYFFCLVIQCALICVPIYAMHVTG